MDSAGTCGWFHYYGRFQLSALRRALRTLDHFIVRWARRKYKRFKGCTMRVWDCCGLRLYWQLDAAVGR